MGKGPPSSTTACRQLVSASVGVAGTRAAALGFCGVNRWGPPKSAGANWPARAASPTDRSRHSPVDFQGSGDAQGLQSKEEPAGPRGSSMR